MNPVSTPMTVTSFQPDLSGNCFVLAQSADGASNIRVLITQADKGNLAVGDPIAVVLSDPAATVAIDAVPVNAAAPVNAEVVALQAANADLQARLDSLEATVTAAAKVAGVPAGDPAAPGP